MQNTVLEWGKAALREEAGALHRLADLLDASFVRTVDAIYASPGKVVIFGMGKSGHIARKIAATLSSTGTPSVFVNPAEGGHGDLGIVQDNDTVILISKSGETQEITQLLPFLRRMRVQLISITGGRDCALAAEADIALEIGVTDEVCPINLAPTTSTTATLALGDALAVALMKKRDFKPEHFAMFHPSGSLGRQLLKVSDLMERDDLPMVGRKQPVRDALQVILTHRNRGVAIIVNDDDTLAGIIVDGDLKRLLLEHQDLLQKPVEEVMVSNPRTIAADAFIGEALQKMEGKVTSLLIVDDAGKPAGLIHIHDILEARVL